MNDEFGLIILSECLILAESYPEQNRFTQIPSWQSQWLDNP
jgi:hypothetical protein